MENLFPVFHPILRAFRAPLATEFLVTQSSPFRRAFVAELKLCGGIARAMLA
jgi:hypothetical protein